MAKIWLPSPNAKKGMGKVGMAQMGMGKDGHGQRWAWAKMGLTLPKYNLSAVCVTTRSTSISNIIQRYRDEHPYKVISGFL